MSETAPRHSAGWWQMTACSDGALAGSRNSVSVSIVIPTFRRGADLTRCLGAVIQQLDRADEIVVVHRAEDTDTVAVLTRFAERDVRPVVVQEPGQIAALIEGEREAQGAVVAFTDDDAVPHRDWLRKLKKHFADPTVGAVGGRDLVRTDVTASLREDVGLITPWGKLVGNHHVGAGPAREVMVLKGVNMAFRRAALSFPAGLRGSGAQVHQEVPMCLACRQAGWRVIYDPEISVDHFPAPRFDQDQRGKPDFSAIRDAAYNYVFSILTFRPELVWRRAVFGIVVGDRAAPGIGRASLALVRRERDVIGSLVPSLVGQSEAVVDVVRGRRVRMISHAREERCSQSGRPR